MCIPTKKGQSVLCFEVETYLSSLSELEKYFPQYLNVLLHAVDRHMEIYFQMNESQQKQLGERTNPTSKDPKVCLNNGLLKCAHRKRKAVTLS